jgi:lysophospholipase L1-like esterase
VVGFAPISVALLAAVGCALLLACQPDRPSPRPITYVALGASDAVGVGTRSPATEGWVPQLGWRLGPGARTVNLGVSGSTLRQALDEQLGPALDARPTLVTVWLAVNDLNARVPLDAYARDKDTLLGALRGTGARVLVANVPDLPRVGVYAQVDAETLRVEIGRWNAVIAGAAARHGAELVDLNANWRELAEHPEYVSADGFHPSVEGYARLAEIFYRVYERSP